MRPSPGFAVLLLALGALAGCLSTPAAPTQAPAPTFAFQDLQRLPGDRLGAEPNLAADGKGNLWLVAVGSVLADPQQNLLSGKVNLWHSGDWGATWTRQRDPGPQDKNGTFCSCDTDVDVGPDGTVYLTDFWVTSRGNGFVVESSTDGGATWAPGDFLTVLVPAGNDRQYILAGKDPGEVDLAMFAGGVGAVQGQVPAALPGAPDPVTGLSLWRSTDSGRTFTPTARLATDGYIAHPHVGPDGTLFYGWTTTPPGADPWNSTATVHIARSKDHGATWATTDVGTAPDGVGGLWPMAFDVGPDGVVHVVWMQRVPGGGSLLRYSRSADGGRTYSPPRNVGWSNGTALLPWVAAAGPDRAVVAFYGNETAVEPLAAPPSTIWKAWSLVVDGNASSAPVAVSPWPVKVGRFCPRGADCDSDRELLDYPAITWTKGWVVVAFAVSDLDAGTGPPHTGLAGGTGPERPEGGHSTHAYVWAARAPLP